AECQQEAARDRELLWKRELPLVQILLEAVGAIFAPAQLGSKGKHRVIWQKQLVERVVQGGDAQQIYRNTD
ncbi:MAG: hypothetical protein PVH75_12350, partial [Syntrophobacterales bacterium]